MLSLKSVMRNAIESWRCEVSKDFVANKVAHHYYKLKLHHEPPRRTEENRSQSARGRRCQQQPKLLALQRTSLRRGQSQHDGFTAGSIAITSSGTRTRHAEPVPQPIGLRGRWQERRLRCRRPRQAAGNHEQRNLRGRFGCAPSWQTRIPRPVACCMKELVESKESHNPLLAYVEGEIANRG